MNLQNQTQATLLAEIQRLNTEITSLQSDQDDRLQLALEVAHIGMWDWNMVTGRITWSRGHEELFGLVPGSFDGNYQTFERCVHPDDRHGLTQVVDHAIVAHSQYRHEYRVVWSDGSIHWIEGRGRAVYDEAGQPVRMIGTVTDIDDRKQSAAQRDQLVVQAQTARQAAQIAQDQVTAILESISDAFVALDTQWRYTYVNQRAGQLFNRRPADLVGKPIWDEFPEGIGQPFYHAYYKAAAEQQPIQLEEYYPPWDRWFENRIYPSSEGLTIFFQDITDRKRAELALRDNEQYLRTILDAEPACVKVITADGILKAVNAAGLAIIEADTIEQALGQCIFPLIDPAHRQEFLEFTKAAVAGKASILEFEGTGLKGTRRWLESHAVPLTIPGDASPYVLAVTRDVSDRKRAETELKQLNAELEQRVANRTADLSKANDRLQTELIERYRVETALQQSEAQFRSAFDNAPIGLALVGLDGRWLRVNAALSDIVGYSASELLETSFQTITYPDDLQTDLGYVQQLLNGDIRHYEMEKRYFHKQGHAVWVQLNVSLVRDRRGQPLYFISQIQDITARREVERMKREFISLISHELRTPLTAIRGSLGILATGALHQHPERAQRMLEIATIDTERLVRLVNETLDLERLESGRVSLVKEICNADALMQRSVEVMGSLAQKATITLAIAPTTAQVWGSADHIIQTLTNLLSNAIKFSPPQTTVSLSATQQGEFVVFQVRDQGRGIPADQLESIFGRFQQVDASDSRQKGGTGLGLAICRSIVQQHGGKIWVESDLNQGSCFYLTLPVPPENALWQLNKS